MRLEITMGEEYLSRVLADLSQRRGNVQEIQDRLDNKVVLAQAPLAELMVNISSIFMYSGSYLNLSKR